MISNDHHDWNSHLRAAWVAVWLRGGSKLTTVELMRLTGMTKQGVENMMQFLSWGMPIDRINGRWQWINEE